MQLSEINLMNTILYNNNPATNATNMNNRMKVSKETTILLTNSIANLIAGEAINVWRQAS